VNIFQAQMIFLIHSTMVPDRANQLRYKSINHGLKGLLKTRI